MFQRLTLKQMILNEIDQQPRGFVEKLAKVAGYSNGGNLKKVLINEKKEFEKFCGLIELVRYCFNNDEQSIMEHYSKEIDPNNRSARMMLEYLSCNRLLPSMKELINRMLVCSNKESVEWAKAYDLQYNWQSNYHILNIDSHLQEIQELKTSIHEVKTFLKLKKSYCYYKKNFHKIAYELLLDLKQDISNINNDYIKNMYTARLAELSSYINLYVLNKPDQARIDAKQVIESNIGSTYSAFAYFTIGYSYFFTSFDKALNDLNKSIEIYKEIGREGAVKDVQETIETLHLFWEKDLSDYKFVYTEARLWNEFRLGNDIANELESLKENIYMPFYYFLKGISINSNEILMQSMIQFIKRGDSFQARIPMIELLRRGYSQDVLNELLQINVIA